MSRTVAVLAGVGLHFATAAAAQTAATYVPFSPSAAKGALYQPDTGPAPTVAVLLIHRTSNFLAHPATRELSQRGFLVLAMNPRSDNNEAAVDFETNALDVRSGIEFLRRQPGIRRVVLFGHSGGGPATSFYQAVAEKGPAYCQGSHKLTPCADDLAGLPKADGLVLVDAHPGVSVNGLRSLNPAVLDERDPSRIDPALDPFGPANGYNPDGASRYPEAFRKAYFKAQANRMNRLIAAALAELNAMRSGTATYPDDNVFAVPRFEGARIMELDPGIHHATVKPQRLLRNDGTVATRIVESVRQPARGYHRRNATFDGGARLMTIRSFLSANAIRAKDSMDDIDWCSSNNSTPCALQNISIPVLITAAGAHYFIRDNEIHYEMAASADKEFIVVEGATHGITPCTPCETTPGQYSNVVKNYFDYVARWINSRFGRGASQP
jgi:pimeloyl-ACP methyl ester carboxylesterase